jgi:hypothetical protein
MTRREGVRQARFADRPAREIAGTAGKQPTDNESEK